MANLYPGQATSLRSEMRSLQQLPLSQARSTSNVGARIAVLLAAALLWSGCQAQIIPPGTLVLGGLPVRCFNYPARIAPWLNDTASFDGTFINLNPTAIQNLPPILQLWAYAHECGHAVQGASETGADAWAVRTGRQQGWFPPQAFQALLQLFQNNPGDVFHPPGPVRVQLMMQAYAAP